MKKVKVLALAVVFALAALGGAYAMWKDTLTIVEKVYTGNLDVYWSDVSTTDCGCNYEANDNDVYAGNKDSMDPENPNDCKNIGCKEAEIITEVYGHKEAENRADTLLVTLINGYPGYQEEVLADITNNGTIPVKFRVYQDGAPDWLIFEWSVVGETYGLEGYQLDPGKTVSIRIIERVRQSAPQDASAQFKITIDAIQWNEYKFKLPDKITFPRKC